MKNILICFFIIISPVLTAQQVITGRITDATDGTPIERVEIFIANTTIGTLTNASGNYSITYQGTGSFEIVVSHVGYQPVFHKIDTPKSSHQYDVALEIREIQEVVISPLKYRQSDVDLFWRRILGVLPSRNGMEVLNPEKVYYSLNSVGVLNVSCEEPIEIINHQMGYRIRYILQRFQYDYLSDVTEFRGMPYFEELIPQNNRERDRWEKNREEVYAVSINRFTRALYQGQIHEEGFLLATRDSSENIVPVLLKDILRVEQNVVLVNIEVPIFLMCYSEPVTTQMIQNSQRDLTRGRGRPIVVEFIPPQQFMIFSDGSYTGHLKIQEHPSSTTFFGLSSLLPAEYGQVIEHLL